MAVERGSARMAGRRAHDGSGARAKRRLWTEYRAGGDLGARSRLLDGYLGLVYHAARELRRGTACGPTLDDLVGAGTVGLIHAFERFDPARGLAFSTFAMPRIRGAMLDELLAESRTPRMARARRRLLARTREKLQQRLGAPPQAHQMAEALNVDLRTFWRWSQEAAGPFMLALDQVVPASDRDRDRRLDETLADPQVQAPEDSLVRAESERLLRDALLAMPERDRLVLTLSFYEELTLREIGRVLGVTESRVSQIRSRALRTLRVRLEAMDRP
jgi:RNA polymerase sigma factor for flagellar operon FliA